jgi:glycosyltransferase involved in cell wall biosynthesis
MTHSILQVNTSDRGGGAESVALALHRAYLARGIAAALAVGIARTTEDGVVPIGEHRSVRGRALRDPRVAVDVIRGREDFRHPASRNVLDLSPQPPSVLHLHNLHGAYFDLRALPDLSARQPTVVTMHDEWLFTGHCAYTLGCDRWQEACGSCPHLDVYPGLRVDGTAGNRRRKAALYERSRLHVVCPSAWLLERAQRSALAPAIASARVIPNGVDLGMFSPGDRDEARGLLDLPLDAHVLVFAAQGARTNPYKDFATLRAALELVGAGPGPNVVAVALGERAADERLGRVLLRSETFVERLRVAAFLRAADLYVHVTRADNHPLAVLEALACGVPVVAARVGGIGEQLREETGVLVEPGDPMALASVVTELLADDARRRRMGAEAIEDARGRFGLDSQVGSYLDLYRELAA